MNTPADKIQKSNIQTIANAVSQKLSSGKSAFHFIDNRPETIAQRKIQEIANSTPQMKQLKVFREKVNEGSQVKRNSQLQAMADHCPTYPQETIGIERNRLRETGKESGINEKLDSKPPIQKYAESASGQYNISENQQFAVSKEDYPGDLYAANGPPLLLAGGLAWNQQGTLNIDDIDYNRYVADISAYEANGIVGSEQHCGAFARGITDNTGATGGDDRSTNMPGGVLKDSNTTPELDDGWANHFAAVVKVDGGDHASFETAVGIPHTWVGIYGVNRGQTFRYKTQEANIERLVAMEDIVLVGQGPRVKGFWDYLLCQPGRLTDLVLPRGITPEQGATYREEMTAWRDHGTQPASEYMTRVVARLEAELQQTGGV